MPVNDSLCIWFFKILKHLKIWLFCSFLHFLIDVILFRLIMIMKWNIKRAKVETEKTYIEYQIFFISLLVSITRTRMIFQLMFLLLVLLLLLHGRVAKSLAQMLLTSLWLGLYYSTRVEWGSRRVLWRSDWKIKCAHVCLLLMGDWWLQLR